MSNKREDEKWSKWLAGNAIVLAYPSHTVAILQAASTHTLSILKQYEEYGYTMGRTREVQRYKV